MMTAPYTIGSFVGSVSACMHTHTFGPSINIVSRPLVNQPLVNQSLVNQSLVHQSLVHQPLVSRSEYTYESNDVVIRDCAEFHKFLKEQDRLDNLDILSKPVLTREKYIIPDDNFVSNYNEFDANLEYDIDGTGLKWVDALFLSGVDNTKRVKYLNNYGEPVYAEYDDDDEDDEEEDDEEDDSRRSFVLFDERSGMGSAMHRSGMMNQSFMNQSFHPFYNLSRYADVLPEVDNDVLTDVLPEVDNDVLTEVDNEVNNDVLTEVLTKVDTTKRVKYLNNYGEPVYAEDDDVDEEDDDEEDDCRRSFVLFDERSAMHQSWM